eukprot:5823981-Alexandrium_andersonii.AAC.1
MIGLRSDLRSSVVADWQPGNVRMKLVPFPYKAPWPWQGQDGEQQQEGAPPRFQFRCASGCGTILDSVAKPQGPPSRWPLWWCSGCGRKRRVARALCVHCGIAFKDCRCHLHGHGEGLQLSMRSFVRVGGVPEPGVSLLSLPASDGGRTPTGPTLMHEEEGEAGLGRSTPVDEVQPGPAVVEALSSLS